MSNFPLYDSLIKDIDTEEFTVKEQDKFIKMIKIFDNDGYEKIYCLIRVFQLENSDDKSTFKLPYGGKFIKQDITFDFNEFPDDLKKILYKFAKIHSKKMKEETSFSS
jgi:uncharacterized protein YPO0396